MVSTKINSKIRTLIPDNASEYFNKNPGSPIHSSSHPQDSPKPTSSEPVVPKSVIPDSIFQGRERKRYATVRCTLREYSLLLNLRVLLQLITGKKVLKLSLNLIPICCTILIYLLPLRMAREIVFNTLWPTLFHLIIFLHLIEHWLPNLTPFICPKLFKRHYRMGIAGRQCKKT